jgi:putative sigma-54 modulation protein
MDIQHTGKDFELTEAIRTYAEDKLGKAASTLSDTGSVRMHVTYEKDGHAQHGDNQAVHVVLFVPSHEPLRVEERAETLYAAIDIAAEALERQVIRYRDRTVSQKRARARGKRD